MCYRVFLDPVVLKSMYSTNLYTRGSHVQMSTCACSHQCMCEFYHTHTHSPALFQTRISLLWSVSWSSMLLTLLVAMSHTGSRYDSSIGVNFTDCNHAYCCDGHSYSSSTPTPPTHTRLPSQLGNHRYILLVCSFLRIVLIPLFLFCNVQSAGKPRAIPVVFNNDAYPVVFNTILGLTNGYFGSLAMIFGPQ